MVCNSVCTNCDKILSVIFELDICHTDEIIQIRHTIFVSNRAQVTPRKGGNITRLSTRGANVNHGGGHQGGE